MLNGQIRVTKELAKLEGEKLVWQCFNDILESCKNLLILWNPGKFSSRMTEQNSGKFSGMCSPMTV